MSDDEKRAAVRKAMGLYKCNLKGEPILCSCGGNVRLIESYDGVDVIYCWNGTVWKESEHNRRGEKSTVYSCKECGREWWRGWDFVGS